MKISHKRISNRKYPAKMCAKSDCLSDFIPTDARQQYCCSQHRIDHNNDKRKVQLAEDFSLIKAIKHNYTVLKKILNAPFYIKSNKVHLSLLEYEKFDLKSFHKKEKLENGNEVLVFYGLGLTCVDIQKGNFEIINIKTR